MAIPSLVVGFEDAKDLPIGQRVPGLLVDPFVSLGGAWFKPRCRTSLLKETSTP